MTEYINMWKNGFNFNGRSRRRDYWLAYLINIIIFIIFSVLDSLIPIEVFSILLGIYTLALIIPLLALTIRRLHDIGKSGFWIFLSLIPFGSIVVLIFLCMDSQGPNEYGDSPKYPMYNPNNMYNQGMNNGYQNPNMYNQGMNNGYQDPNMYNQGMNNSYQDPNMYNQGMNNGYQDPNMYNQGMNNSYQDPNIYNQGMNNNYQDPNMYNQGMNNGYQDPNMNNQGINNDYQDPNMNN